MWARAPQKSRAGRRPSVGRLWWDVLVRPRPTVASLAEAATVRQGMLATCGFAGLYSLAAWTSYRTGRRPRQQTLTFIPPDRYYQWESMFMAPLTVAWMGLLALFVRAGAGRVGGRGTVGRDFAVLAVTHTAPLVVLMWLPDMACYLARLDEGRYARLLRFYVPAATAWAIGLATAGTAAGERIRWNKALLVVVSADAASAVVSGVALAVR